MFVDSHCHLDFPELAADLPHVLEAMRANLVTHALCIGVEMEAWPRVHALAVGHANLYASVGVHPDYTDLPEPTVDLLVARSREPKVVAIGETGLDFYRDHAPRETQEKWFRAQIALATELGLPVVIHQRSACNEVLEILEQTRPEPGGVLHCFDDGSEVVERARVLGFKLGLGGCLTYGHAELDEAVRAAPADMLMLETDAPYLEPEPRSLRRNEPALLKRVVRRLCELRGWTPEEAVRVTRTACSGVQSRSSHSRRTTRLSSAGSLRRSERGSGSR